MLAAQLAATSEALPFVIELIAASKALLIRSLKFSFARNGFFANW